MVTILELRKHLKLEKITEYYDEKKEISNGYTCDLLSWVMAKGENNMAWITVQTHLNVVAVACLHDFSCIIIPESIEIPENTIKKANEEGIMIFSSEKSSYEICCIMNEVGIGKK